jgi:ABC-2 type transport system permease protein
MVMDPQNEAFPVQVQRQVGAMQVIEIQEVDYPFFVDVRGGGMDDESSIVANLPAVTMQWSSPLALDDDKNADREVTVLLQSTEESWLRTDVNVQPDPQLYPEYGFPLEGVQESHPLAVSIRGSFESYFGDKASPFEESGASVPLTGTVEAPLGTIPVSPESSQLVVFGSTEFIDDAVLQISRQLSADRYLNNLQLFQNAVDWSVEDDDLLTIRSRGTFARLLKPMEQSEQSLWEGINYVLALLALVTIAALWYWRRRNEQPMELVEPGAEKGGSDE